MALIEVQNLTYRYPDGTLALADVGFRMEEGQAVGLVGPNGAGKSTLLWHLNGLLPERLRDQGNPDPIQTSASQNGRHDGRRQGSASHDHRPVQGREGQGRGGSVQVDGLVVCRPNLPQVRRSVGLVFQDPDDQLFCSTIGEDVAFGPFNLGLERDEVRRRVSAALAAVGLDGFEDRLPHRLSLGERKRACLAGVLACQPRLLALDEPSANLDPRARRRLISILRSLDCALLVASHDLELILELCPRVLLLDAGRLHADGPARQVLGDERLLEEHGLELPRSLR